MLLHIQSLSNDAFNSYNKSMQTIIYYHPLAWALVPNLHKCSVGYGFLKCIKEQFLRANKEDRVIIAADNVQSKFGLTCRNQFWKVARAKNKRAFKIS